MLRADQEFFDDILNSLETKCFITLFEDEDEDLEYKCKRGLMEHKKNTRKSVKFYFFNNFLVYTLI